jgi:hypothetical protein
MQKLLLPTLLLAAALTLVGCSTYWYQQGKGFEQCKQDRAECQAELLKRSDLRNLTMQYELDFLKNCMAEKGYNVVPQNKLPLDVKRAEPDTSWRWFTPGVAGSLQE